MTISTAMITTMDELLRGRKEISVNALFPILELQSTRLPLNKIEEKIVAPELASRLAHFLSEMLIENSMMSSTKDDRRFNSTEYRVRVVVLTESEWTLLHRIKNSLVAEFGVDIDPMELR